MHPIPNNRGSNNESSATTTWRNAWHWLCGWPSDVFLWLTIALVVVTGVALWRHQTVTSGALNELILASQTLVLHTTDANDIKPGANVYFLGVHVGTVEEVRFPFDRLRNGVAVVVTTHKKLPPLANNLGGYILFNSLAGAKEIHLVPPKDGEALIASETFSLGSLPSRRLIDIEAPIRLRDVMTAQVDSNQYLKEGAQTLSTLFGTGGLEHSRLSFLQENIQASQALSLAGTEMLTQSQQLLSQWGPKLVSLNATTTIQLNHIETNLHKLALQMQGVHVSQAIHQFNSHLQTAQQSLSATQKNLQPFTLHHQQLNQQLGTIQSSLQQHPPMDNTAGL